MGACLTTRGRESERDTAEHLVDAGKTVLCVAHSEADAGSDAAEVEEVGLTWLSKGGSGARQCTGKAA